MLTNPLTETSPGKMVNR